MITVLSANFAQVSGTKTEFWFKLNYQIEPKTNEGKCEAKQHKLISAWLAQRLWTEKKLCKKQN